MITDEQLAEWEGMAEEATPGPWRMYNGWGESPQTHCAMIGAPGAAIVSGENGSDIVGRREDFEFIATSRDAVPALIAEARRYRDKRHIWWVCPTCVASYSVLVHDDDGAIASPVDGDGLCKACGGDVVATNGAGVVLAKKHRR